MTLYLNLLKYFFIPIIDKVNEYQEVRQFLCGKVGDTTKYILFSRFLDIIKASNTLGFHCEKPSSINWSNGFQ